MPNSSAKQTVQQTLPIGIFDSGIGGLSIAQHIKQHLPNESLVYIADNLHAPYGEKTDEFISQRVLAISEYLTKHPVKAIVVACNTATVTAINKLRKHIDIPIIGVEPAIKPAALTSNNKKVGVLVTQATSTNERFHELIHTYASGADIYIQPCPGLVELIEMTGNNLASLNTLLAEFLTPLVQQPIDTLVLGCTHYPLIKTEIQAHLSGSVQVIDTAAPVTAQLERILLRRNLLCQKQPNKKGDIFYTTSLNADLATKLQEIWIEPTMVKTLNI